MLHKQVSFIVDSKGAKQAAVVPIDIYNELMTLQKALSDNKPGERELYHFNGKGAEAHGYPVGKRQNPGFMVQAGSTANGEDAASLREAVIAVSQQLAQAIVRDGEGATKFITVRVEGGRTVDECKQVAYAIAHSPLVKTAFFASDPNLGRILAAVGYAGIDDLEVDGIDLHLGDVHVVHQGGRHPDYREEDGQRVMKAAEILVRVGLGRGQASETVWTCDFSHDYVTINADYRS